MSSPTLEGLSPAWLDILDNVLKTLAEAEEQVLRAEVPAEPLSESAAVNQLSRLDDRLQQFKECVDRACQTGAETHEKIQAATVSLQSWLQSAHTLSTKLSKPR